MKKSIRQQTSLQPNPWNKQSNMLDFWPLSTSCHESEWPFVSRLFLQINEDIRETEWHYLANKCLRENLNLNSQSPNYSGGRMIQLSKSFILEKISILFGPFYFVVHENYSKVRVHGILRYTSDPLNICTWCLTFSLLICTWILKNQVRKLKFDQLEFKPSKINFEIDFCRLHRQ